MALDKKHQTAALLLLINTLLFASNVMIAKLAVGKIPPFTLAFFRWFTAFLLFVPFKGKAFFSNWAGIKKEWKQFLLLGTLGMLICGGLPFKAAHLTSANNLALVYTFSAVVIIVFERIFYKVAIRSLQIIGISLGTLGVAYILFQGNYLNVIHINFNYGDLLVLVAAIVWAIYSLRLKYVPSVFSRDEKFLGNMLGGAIMLFPFYIMELDVNYTFDLNTLWFFLALGLFPSLLAFLLYQKIQDMTSSSFAGVVFYLVPLVNALNANILLGETLKSYHIIGGAIALVGVYLDNKKTAK